MREGDACLFCDDEGAADRNGARYSEGEADVLILEHREGGGKSVAGGHGSKSR